jgi:hypothetical protein
MSLVSGILGSEAPMGVGHAPRLAQSLHKQTCQEEAARPKRGDALGQATPRESHTSPAAMRPTPPSTLLTLRP